MVIWVQSSLFEKYVYVYRVEMNQSLMLLQCILSLAGLINCIYVKVRNAADWLTVVYVDQQKHSERECVHSSLCVLPPFQARYDVFLVDFGK